MRHADKRCVYSRYIAATATVIHRVAFFLKKKNNFIIIIIKPRQIDNASIVRAHNGVVIIIQVGRGQQKSVCISFWKNITNKKKVYIYLYNNKPKE